MSRGDWRSSRPSLLGSRREYLAVSAREMPKTQYAPACSASRERFNSMLPTRYEMWIACFNSETSVALCIRRTSRTGSARASPEVTFAQAYESSDALTLVERLLDVDIQTFLPDQLLVKMDIASMAHSLEVRSPLLDHVFMEMAASLPVSAKISRGTSKRLLKRRRPPMDPRQRPRRARSAALRCRSHTGCETNFVSFPQRFFSTPTRSAAGCSRGARSNDLSATISGVRQTTPTKLWALIQLELWFRTYVDVQPQGPITLDFAELLSRPGCTQAVPRVVPPTARTSNAP